ncbi:retrovirus-related pol polyprotein from transposon TNT 1-94 [Tanacetum coccineum]
MTTPITTSTTDSQMHNNIMATGSRDRPPMLAIGRYAQWQSCFLRYIDTRPNSDALRKCILEGTNSFVLTGIRDEIYSTVDACNIAHEMWIAIKRLQQGESLNIQDVKTNLFGEFRKFTSHDGESMESYYSRFYKIMNEMRRNNLTVATMQVNYQKEGNEIRAERIAKNANRLALVAAASPYPDPYYQAPNSHKPYAPTSKPSSSTRSNASTKFKGKEIAKPITPPFESASEEDSDPKQAQRDTNMQKNLALIAKYFKKIYKPTNNNLKTFSNSKNKNMDTSSRYKNDNQTGQFGNQRIVTIARARETIGSQGFYKFLLLVQLSTAKRRLSTAKLNTDEEIDEQELEAHYRFMAKIQEVPTADSGTDTEPLEHVDNNVIPDSSDMCDNDIQTDQNAIECDDERVVLANLIANLKLDTELETYKTLNDRTVDYDKLEHKLNETLGLLAQKEIDIKEELVDQAWEKHSHDHFCAPTAHDMEILIKTCLMPLAIKTQNDSFTFVHELKQEMHADLKFLNDVNARTKKPKVVHISTRQPKHQAIKSVTSKSTIQKSKIYYRMLYEKTTKAWKWWIEQQCPSGYKWVPKTKMKLVPKVRNEHMQKRVSFVIDNASRITNIWRLLFGNLLVLLDIFRETIYLLKDVVIGLPKLKYDKDQLSSSYEVSKSKRSSFKTKVVPSSKGRLNLLHMDLRGPMRIVSINGKIYIMVIVDDYSRYTWTLFLRFKDETPEVLKDFLKMIQRNLQAPVISVQTDRGTKFLKKTLHAHFKE